jgi:hypothetical protein
MFRDWQRTQTQSSVTALRARDSKWMSGSAKAGTTAERHTLRAADSEYVGSSALLRCARQENCFFS